MVYHAQRILIAGVGRSVGRRGTFRSRKRASDRVVPAARPPSMHRVFGREHGRGSRTTCSGRGEYAFVGGGGGNAPNTAAGFSSGVLSGEANFACGEGAGVGVGFFDETDGPLDFIGGGKQNYTDSFGGFIGGGLQNSLTGLFSGTVAGYNNNNQGFSSLIGTGQNNSTTALVNGSNCQGGCETAIVAGSSNTINGKQRRRRKTTASSAQVSRTRWAVRGRPVGRGLP